MKRQITINVKEIFTESYIQTWPQNGTDLFLFLIDLSHTYKEISSPDLNKNASGLTCTTKQKSLGLDLFRAEKNGTINLESIGQRKGYKSYIFSF